MIILNADEHQQLHGHLGTLHTQRISSGLYSSLHFNVSLSILVAFLTFQFLAVRYLAIDASVQ